MPRFRSSPGRDLPDVDDYAPVVASLNAISLTDSVFKDRAGVAKKQLQLDWTLDDSMETSVRDWVNLSTGMMRDGTPSKLRMLLCALAAQPIADEPWIDTDSMEYGWGDVETAVPTGVLAVGAQVQVRGKVEGKGNPPIDTFVVQVYEPLGATRGRSRAPVAATPARPVPTPTTIPAGAGGKPAAPAQPALDDF